jgi:hypothetical protein
MKKYVKTFESYNNLNEGVYEGDSYGYEIIDNNGTIHSSSDLEEMNVAFTVMVESKEEIADLYGKEEAERLIKEYKTGWEGDLKIVSILDIAK